uniref:Secreted protein n=1 Tax=Leersia perrieri TaxID=77586 RepID=A0A0D9XHF4_9ORYZ
MFAGATLFFVCGGTALFSFPDQSTRVFFVTNAVLKSTRKLLAGGGGGCFCQGENLDSFGSDDVAVLSA